ncbi:MAG: hypothetical protein WC346_13290 [Methanogenium sp.]
MKTDENKKGRYGVSSLRHPKPRRFPAIPGLFAALYALQRGCYGFVSVFAARSCLHVSESGGDGLPFNDTYPVCCFALPHPFR